VSVSKKVADYLTPEKLTEHAQIRADVEAEFPDIKERARRARANTMRRICVTGPSHALPSMSSGSTLTPRSRH